ncbi:RNA polymerase sigma factor [Paraferrimonas sp. SM1919]|uniref:RNA polymerase sigma factor n=1 Tax=Paraferrimonas sp. SM1919 TaxID=2662263 RepID=UPI0013D32294|nr:RNA polymerase sigma factor [Paraferrimonas sp. SM1919]
MTKEVEIAEFFAQVEGRALQMARTSTRNLDEAMDIVQDTMLKLISNYSDKASEDWTPLFYRILQNKITDWHRKQTLKKMLYMTPVSVDEDFQDYLTEGIDHHNSEKQTQLNDATQAMQLHLSQLPLRQQQVFMLRCWQGFSTAEAATIMGCTQGSIKTHYSRALAKMQAALKDYYYD